MPGLTVTLTTHGTVYNLYTLIKASFPNAAGACRELTVTSDAANGVDKVYIGGNDVTSSSFGIQLATSQSVAFRSDRNNVSITGKAATSDTDGSKLDLEWEYA